ncbi:MAG: hypothetical protein KBC06_01025 [Candidatus Pacebacteria bacterium]|nr:hypothetical protein [Candidatus Paceibacterota bacterium]
MDQKELQEKIAEYYSKLPPKLQEAFSSMKWLETIQNVSSTYGLTDQQKETLGTETTLVLLGIIHPEEYEEILKTELGLSPSMFENIVQTINTSILNAQREELGEVFQANAETLVEEKELDERFGNLPQEIQQAIIDSNYHAVLYQIAQNEKLTVEQMGILEKLTTDIMLGVTHPEKFEESLKQNLGLSNEKVVLLVDEINNKILKSIRMKAMSASKTSKQSDTYNNDEQIDHMETKVLDDAGITILSGDNKQPSSSILPNLVTPEISAPKQTPVPVPVTPTPQSAPILAQKLANSFNIPTTKTEHKLENISKSAPKTYPPKADPYRLAPGE